MQNRNKNGTFKKGNIPWIKDHWVFKRNISDWTKFKLVMKKGLTNT